LREAGKLVVDPAESDQEASPIMALIIVLNAIFAVLVVGGILALLGWGIASDRVATARLTQRRRSEASRRQPAHRLTPVYTRGS
jgi:hypothetical protein